MSNPIEPATLNTSGTTLRSFLVVIDMQVAFADQTSEWAVPEYRRAEAAIQQLILDFEDRVVYTRFVPDPAEHGSWGAYYDHWSTMRQPPSSPMWDLTLNPVSGSSIVSLPTFSKWGEELREAVGPTAPLVLCGVATDCCVLSTALAAADNGRTVTVIDDACAGVSSRHHDEALSLLGLLTPMVNVISSDKFRSGVAPATS